MLLAEPTPPDTGATESYNGYKLGLRLDDLNLAGGGQDLAGARC